MSRPHSAPQNPLLTDWTGPFGLPPLPAIDPEHFRPAFDRALGRPPRRDRRHRRQPGGAQLRQHHRGAGEERARPRPRLQRLLRAGRRRHRRRHRGDRARYLAAARPPQQRALSRPRALRPHRRALWPARLARPQCRAGPRARPLPHPFRAGRRLRSTSRRRIASPPSTSGWRASAPSSGRTCWRTRKPTRLCWRRAISQVCPISPAPPPARRRKSAATPANTPSRWRAPHARAFCNSRRAATYAKKSSRPGSGAARTAAPPTTAR